MRCQRDYIRTLRPTRDEQREEEDETATGYQTGTMVAVRGWTAAPMSPEREEDEMMDTAENGETLACTTCGQLLGIEQYDDALWDLQSRRADGRQHREAIVYDGESWPDFGDPEEDREVANMVMGRNMAERGLCPTCGRPNLAGLGPDDFVSEEDARELAEMAAEQAAERRAGC